jgi:beta-glucosidase/6-phospho-beta-glucosidase/beta-galactosidase
VVDGGYFNGVHAPGMKDRALGYRVGHHLLRAHAYAVARYRASRHGDGQISLALNMSYSFPDSDSAEDRAAAERAMLNFGGWFGDPVHFGDYPAVMRSRLGSLLPQFSAEDRALLKGSIDFITLNYYTSDRIRHAPGENAMDAAIVPQPLLPKTEMGWPIVPTGLYRLLRWLSQRYSGLPIVIAENGAALDDQPDDDGFVDDPDRIRYLADHIAAMAAAVSGGVDVRGYFAWSLMDNLEWSLGYSKRFGLIRCDRETLARTIKASGHWYAGVIAAGRIDPNALHRAMQQGRAVARPF